jgi:hypothetical protein
MSRAGLTWKVAAPVFLCAFALASQTPFFPVSVWYSGGKAHPPMLSLVGPESEREWRADLATIKTLGFNTVRTWVEWSACEPAAFERRHGRGSAIILGTFAGEPNQLEPSPMHPLADILTDWAGLTNPQLEASAFVELRRMSAPSGELVFLFNHNREVAKVEFSLPLMKASGTAREIVLGEAMNWAGSSFKLAAGIPGESVRIYRIDH